MNKDFYNSKDSEYEHVIKLLKELPRETAPDNFEYNLKVRIENKNFGTLEKSSFPFFKVLLPVTSTVFASIILFFVFFNETDDIENPFQILPQIRSSITQTVLKSVTENINNYKKERITPNDVILSIEEETPVEKVVAENIKSKPDFPFENYDDTNLDEVLNDKRNETNINSRATLAGGGGASSSFFDGFYIREEVDKEYVEALKARLDSLNQLMKKNNIKK